MSDNDDRSQGGGTERERYVETGGFYSGFSIQLTSYFSLLFRVSHPNKVIVHSGVDDYS